MRDPGRIDRMRPESDGERLRPEWGTPARTCFNNYWLYLAGVAFPVCIPAAVIIAIVNRRSGPDWIQTHYRFQIRTFWMTVLALVACTLLGIAIVSLTTEPKLLWLDFFVLVGWYIMRNVKGMQHISNNVAHPMPATWLF